MKFFVGTSGFSYPQWKGKFYPPKLPASEMLHFYGQQFSTVEINNSMYRMPEASVLKAWLKHVPADFRFVIKAPQTITHYRRLKNVEAPMKDFLGATLALKKQRGPLLFQLGGNFKKDLPRLKDFLKLLGTKTPAVFEFRHESWFDDDVYKCLRARSCALCVDDAEEFPRADLIETAKWGYFRLRREKYTIRKLADWIRKIKAQRWNEVYVYFKHEDAATGPALAKRFLELADR
jgi:uncharacterized protein YecE (DUF72 family)